MTGDRPKFDRAAKRYRENRLRYQEMKTRWRELRKKVRPGAMDSLERAHRVDLVYTTNAIEGNTLTVRDTELVLEKGITVAGKPLRDHLEAEDGAHALDWIRQISSHPTKSPLIENDIRSLHQALFGRSHPGIAGRYADIARYVNTSAGIHAFPPPLEIPALMREFAAWLGSADDSAETAFDAHLRLVEIHPFEDGNGRTARLLMNLILLRADLLPVSLPLDHRQEYYAAIEQYQETGDASDFHDLLARRLAATMTLYTEAARQALPQSIQDPK